MPTRKREAIGQLMVASLLYTHIPNTPGAVIEHQKKRGLDMEAVRALTAKDFNHRLK